MDWSWWDRRGLKIIEGNLTHGCKNQVIGTIQSTLRLACIFGQSNHCLGAYHAEILRNKMDSQAANAEGKHKGIAQLSCKLLIHIGRALRLPEIAK